VGYLWRFTSVIAVTCAVAIFSARGDGWSTLRMGDEPIEVFRDSFGVPHVYAQTFRGMFFGQGYVSAEDRLWQLETYRRDAKGELAEYSGKKRLDQDRRVREQSRTEAERRHTLERMNPEMRLAIEGLRDGINARIAEVVAVNALPKQYRDLNVTPRLWTETDTIAIAEMMSRRFGSGGDEEVEIQEILNKLVDVHGDDVGRAMLDDLLPLNDKDAPTTMPKTYAVKFRVGRAGHAPAVDARTLAALVAVRENQRTERQVAEEIGSFTRLGSNAWVLAPKKSASGNAILFGGPMMGFNAPQIAYEVHLNGPAYANGEGRMNVIGMAFAGIPTVLIGHNATTAWTTTSGGGNVSDLYIEELNPDNANQYRFKGEWRDFQRFSHTYRIRQDDGTIREESYDALRTVHGPVLRLDVKEGVAVSVKHSYWADETYVISDAFLNFNRQATPDDFLRACSTIQTSHNFFYADNKGNIAYAWVGRYPIRPDGTDARLPLRGTGEEEWEGFLPFEALPKSVNPEQGYFGNWNNKPADDWDFWLGRVFWGQRIYDRLSQEGKMTLQQAMDLARETGTNDFVSDVFRPYLALATNHPRMGGVPDAMEVANVVRDYDAVLGVGSAGERIFDTFVRELTREIFADEMPFLFEKSLSNETLLALMSLSLRVFEPKKSYLQPSRDYLNGEPVADVCAQALEKTLAALGPDSSKWNAEVRQIRLGDAATVPWARRGTFMQIVELFSPTARGWNVLPPGQSGDPESPHYKDQVELFGKWLYKPTVIERDELDP
jgi:penicillin amidase